MISTPTWSSQDIQVTIQSHKSCMKVNVERNISFDVYVNLNVTLTLITLEYRQVWR